MNFEITPAAEKFIRMMLRADGCPGSGFRLAVSPGGCSGLSADISIRREPSPGDAVVERDGVKLFLPAESRILLDGVTIDFADTASQTGLVFRDPKGFVLELIAAAPDDGGMRIEAEPQSLPVAAASCRCAARRRVAARGGVASMGGRVVLSFG